MKRLILEAMSDMSGALRLRRVWIELAQEDIGDQHKRTTLGPFWLLINYLAFAGTFIFIFRRSEGDADYAPYVATGLLVWFYIMEVITQSVTLFAREESFIKGTTLPLSVYVMRTAMQSVIRAAYALIGCLVILVLSGIPLSAAWAWSLLGLLVIVAIAPAAIAVFAFLGVFFPDSQFVVSNLMRVGMFVTPVFWTEPGDGGLRDMVYNWNPFTHFLDLVRVPILTGAVPFRALGYSILIGLALWLLAVLLLGRFRRQVALIL